MVIINHVYQTNEEEIKQVNKYKIFILAYLPEAFKAVAASVIAV